jgi:hypothetical protein
MKLSGPGKGGLHRRIEQGKFVVNDVYRSRKGSSISSRPAWPRTHKAVVRPYERRPAQHTELHMGQGCGQGGQRNARAAHTA